MHSDEKLQLYNIKELLNNKYVIPIYQRNFAWSEGEIRQLILDIADASENTDNYYIGTLITYDRGGLFEIIDGQQRLTTLSILLSLIKNEFKDYFSEDLKNYISESKKSESEKLKLNLTFDSRKNSTETLKALYNNPDKVTDNKYSDSIIEGYAICKNVLSEKLEEKFKNSETKFFDYLFNNIKILQVLVLEDTDLNHYFEIMNSRGEQLEMHEILKARLLEKLCDNDKYIFNLIWEACSNMERYIQFGFKKDLRNNIFGKDWNSLINEEELYKLLDNYKDNSFNINNKIEITDIIDKNENTDTTTNNNNKDTDEQERFNSIINFSNFLLHVLKIQETNKDIPLDDKRLLETFDKFLNEEDEEKLKEFIKSFGYNLLKIKFLFDKYIIKRELKSDNWSLKQLKLSEEKSNYKDSFSKNDSDDENDTDINKKILMLLSMFHTSYPTLVYKNWLNDVLKYLYNEENIDAKNYQNELKKLAKERYNKINENGENILNKGTSISHFIFNYLDYLLWEDDCYKKYINGNDNILQKIKNFKFTFRSSVEHYYPQHPLSGKTLDKEILDNFGNLCLISRSKNSKLSNNLPIAKKEHYLNRDIDSIKQAIMMSYDEWGKEKIMEHGEEMKKLLNP